MAFFLKKPAYLNLRVMARRKRRFDDMCQKKNTELLLYSPRDLAK